MIKYTLIMNCNAALSCILEKIDSFVIVAIGAR